MTPVNFHFQHPDGAPVANAPFTLTLRRAGFLEADDSGVAVPDVLTITTDADGKATVSLMPLNQPYYLQMELESTSSEDACSSGGVRYRFYVPKSDLPIDFETILITDPALSLPWDEAALLAITDAKAATKVYRDEAEVFANRAETAAEGVEEFAVRAETAAIASEASAGNAANSELAANLSAQASNDAKLAAELARDQSRTSELATKNSENAAAGSAAAAADRVVESQTYADESKAARDAAIAAQNAAAQSADETAADVLTTGNNVTLTEQNKAATAADVITVTGLKDQAGVFKDQAEDAAQRAEDALGSITGVIADGGPIDLSGGTYPAKPNVSTVWRVTVGGTVTSTPEGTITYFEGDQLNYTKDQDIFYRTATAVRVSSVAGRTGDVVLAKTDVGLENVDNTSDMDKPISTAQQAAFAARTPTVGRQDTTAGRLIKVGDYGENGGGAIVMNSSQDANSITIGGTYVFNGGGLNLPFGQVPVYLKHFNHAVANYSKQLAYGLLNDSCAVRTNNNGVWSDWKPMVDIVDSLTSADPAKALSARQGKILLEMLQANNATIVRYTFNVAAGQTTITGNSLEGVPLSYVPGVPFMVEKDGFPIWLGADYTATNGSSITLTQATALASQFAITVFGSFSAADHYTKAQADARYYQKTETFTKTEVNALVQPVSTDLAALQAEVNRVNTADKGMIAGLVLKHDSNIQVTVSAGSAFIPGANGIVTLAADATIATNSLTASTFYNVYLYGTGNAGAVEISTAKPVKYFGTAYTKTGDTSRRYLGSILSNGAGNGVWAFVHEPVRGQMNYNVSVPSGSPFNTLWQGFTSTTPVLVNPGNIVPIEVTTEIHAINSSGAGLIQVSPTDAAAAPGGGNWDYACSNVGHLIIRLARKGADLGKFNAWLTASSTSSCYVRGYVFER